jgi:hypothetical protein
LSPRVEDRQRWLFFWKLLLDNPAKLRFLSSFAMKRLIVGGLVLLLLVIAVFLWRQTRESLLASQIAPLACVAYIELPNIAETTKRWPDAALCRILSEPSVQRFLRQPISKAPANYQNAWTSFAALQCSSLFFGMTAPDHDQWICGLRTSVDESTWRREIAEISKALFGQNIKEIAPENLEHQGTEMEKADKDLTENYCTRVGSWILLSRSPQLLLEAVRNAKTTSAGLQSLKLFQECRENVPPENDLLSFVRGGPSIDGSAGLHWSFGEQGTAGSDRAVMVGTTIVGARLRDTVFTFSGTTTKASPLERRGLAMTSPSTIGYLATEVGFAEIWKWCGQLAEHSQLAETIRNYLGQVKSFGVEPRDLDKLVSGAEMIVDRDLKSDSLNGAISLRVSDPQNFQHLVDQVVTEKFSENCTKIEVASIPAYLFLVNERISIVFGLVGHQFLISGSQSNFAELVHRLQSRAGGLEADDQYKAIAKMVDEPNVLFAYLDAKSGFERFYEASRPMLAFGIVLMPTLNRYVDAMALPETEDISKHLSPIVLSRHRVAYGVVDESVGPVTAYDAVALLLGGALALGLFER